MLTTLNGMFLRPKPHKINYIKENKKRVKEISSMVNQNSSKSRFDITRGRNSQMEVCQSTSSSSTVLRELKGSNPSLSKLSAKGSMAVFLNERKSKGSTPVVTKQKSSHRGSTSKNQSSQTIDPRRCDQLYHEGVIKYPSNKVMQELAEIEKKKANRLDAHIKKEYFKRNRIKQKSPKKLDAEKVVVKKCGRGDEVEDISSEEEKPETDNFKEHEPEVEPEPDSKTQELMPGNKAVKQSPQPIMRASDIIRKTTEDINYSPKNQSYKECRPNSKGDSRTNKNLLKKLSQEDEILKTVLDPQCPPGHIPLPDSERKKTLHMLRVSHAELVREMNLLPVRTDTLRVRQRKIQLENQLNKIEEGIKVFNKSKVYVKIEE